MNEEKRKGLLVSTVGVLIDDDTYLEILKSAEAEKSSVETFAGKVLYYFTRSSITIKDLSDNPLPNSPNKNKTKEKRKKD